MRPGKRKPAAGNLRASDAISGLRALYGRGKATPANKGWQSPRLPANWRARLSDPLRLACLAIDDARGHLQDYAQSHDAPPLCIVDVADQLDNILDVLAGEVTP